MASHPQLPIFIFTTSLATSLMLSCRSASPGIFFLQRLPAPGSRLHCFDLPPPCRLFSRKSACSAKGYHLPACHARPLEACDASFRLDSFAMESIASGVWTWRRCLCMNGLFLSLQDVNARTMEARRDGGLHVCFRDASESGLSGPAGWERTDHRGDSGWGLAHRSKRIHGELVFALLILTSWGLHVFSRHMRTLFLHQNRLKLSKGGFTGDGSSLG